MLMNSGVHGVQPTRLGESQFNNLVRRSLRAKMPPEEKNLRVYENGYLPAVG